MTNGNKDEFDDFRRARQRNQLDEDSRVVEEHEEIVRALEEVEAKEVSAQRLTREVHDFFVDATRTAAQMVTQVAESAEREHAVLVAQEMSDFLTSTLQRAQQFVVMMQSRVHPNVARSELQPNMQNLVGPALDSFRHEGNSRASDLHIGLDPFAVDLEKPTPRPSPAPTPIPISDKVGTGFGIPSPAAPVEEHLVAEVIEDDGEPIADPVESLETWFRALCSDPEQVKTALRALVKAQSMSRETARSIWVGLHAAP